MQFIERANVQFIEDADARLVVVATRPVPGNGLHHAVQAVARVDSLALAA